MVSPIVIGGPTGSGKSAYAISLAKEISGEIICADSRQIYQHMIIGTASPSIEDCTMVPHHNYNILDPNKDYDAGNFIEDTDRKVQEIVSRGNVPIIVGGTGMYLRSWHFGLEDVPGKDETVRERLRKRLDEEGLQILFDELVRHDKETASAVGDRDQFRILRALEIFYVTGKKPSELRRSHLKQPRMMAQWRLILPEREILNERLLRRTQKMFCEGFIDEAAKLRQYVNPDNKLLKTIGYEECLMVLDGALSQEQAIEKTFIRTRQYAKRQVNWFSKEDYWQRVFVS